MIRTFIFPETSRRLRTVLLAGSLALAGAMAQAEITLTYETGGHDLFRIDAPDNWVISTGGNVNPDEAAPDEFREVPRLLSMLPEGNPGVWVGFFSPDAVSTFAEAADYVRSLGKGLVSDAEVSLKKDMRIGGRRAQVFHGSGQRKGRRVVFDVALIDLPRNRVAIAIMLGENGARSGYIDAINGIFASFRVLN